MVVGLVFTGAHVVQVLKIYEELVGQQLAMYLPLSVQTTEIDLKAPPSVSKVEAARLMEQALRDQAGVVIASGSSNVLKVGYNPDVRTKK
jgi:hypothetical protein